MNKPILALGLVLGLSGSLASVALADQNTHVQSDPAQQAVNQPPLQLPQQMQASDPNPAADFNNGVNPETNVPVSGPYDQADRYRTSNGFPIPGDSQMLYGRP